MHCVEAVILLKILLSFTFKGTNVEIYRINYNKYTFNSPLPPP